MNCLVRVTPTTKKILEAQAKKANMPMSALITHLLKGGRLPKAAKKKS